MGGLSSDVEAPPVFDYPLAVSDSALEELAVGRYWHATRMLRDEGAASGSPADVLALARAEAGWENWPAVLDLLADAPWLEETDGSVGLLLYARALEQGGAWAQAAEAYGAVLRSGVDERTAAVAATRRTRVLREAGNGEAALRELTSLRATPHLRSWMAVESALAAADVGDVSAVQRFLEHAIAPAAAQAAWRARADAMLVAGDSAAALREFEALRSTQSGTRRATATVEVGILRMAAGDSAAARSLLIEGLEASRGSANTRAAAALTDLGGHDFERTLALARALNRAGDGGRALRGYDRAVALAAAEGRSLSEGDRLARARLMGTVRDRQAAALDEFRALRDSTEDRTIGARNLEAWAQLRARQGMTVQVNTLRRWLLEEYPESSEAAEVVWSQGSNAEGRGALDTAVERYAFLAENVPSHTRAGQARMRSGQIHLRRGNLEAAAIVFEQYLTDFPTGRRWQEAAYWAGRTRLELGDRATAERWLNHAMSEPIQYYAVMAAELLDVPFAVSVPAGEAPTEPGWLTEGLARLDALDEAGLQRGATVEIERLEDRAGSDRGPRLRLAGALIERGRTIDGINLGWAILSDEGSWDQEILNVTYPFPYRELVRREAAEWGIDPFMMAAIIRQESAFKADIVSHAGAIGLMQVMPPTGAQLARAHGPDGFTDESLTKPEVNLHLGAAFFVDMSRRYDNDLPLVLSAYNAGPTRATRWRRYPEAVDPLRFTERIPFVETRGYVKSVRRNLGLYRALYGQD